VVAGWRHGGRVGVPGLPAAHHDGRFDILETPDGYMLRENVGSTGSPDWSEVDTYDTLRDAEEAAGEVASDGPPAYSPHSGDPDGYDRNGAWDGFQVTSDADSGL
jgi:hypothetical protein